jgi:uncharacterized lipoprotein NlpE involved in copper resistance
MRSTPGARALTVLAGVVLLVVLVAVVLNLLGDDDNPTVAPDQTTTTADTGTDDTGGGDDTVPPSQTVITPASVDASSELAGFEAANLIDGDTGTYWNDSSQRGVGAVLTFNFAQPVAITEMELVNIPDPVAFRRNYRMRDIQITVDDLAVEVPWSLPDNNEPARVPLNTLETRRVTVTVLSTYIGEPVEDTPSFTELAGFEASNLIDGDTGTYWNDSSQRGVGAVLTFNFAQPVAITEMELVNIPDPVAFRRNYRMRDIQITVDDLAVEVPWSLPDNNEPARVPLNTLETRRVTVTVLSTYIGEPVEDTPSFTELALAEVRFFGSVTETSTP